MLFSQLSLLLACTTFAAAQPINKRWFWGWLYPNPSDTYLRLYERNPNWNPETPDPQPGNCDLATALSNMPPATPPLPAPATSLTLSHVAIGRGTQNYTCDLSNSTAVPAAVGALASLFNVSCLAANSPALLAKLPPIALELQDPSTDSTNSAGYQDLSGHHFFTDATTAFFDLVTTDHNFGTGAFKKVNSSSAPTGSPKGQNDQGFGSVAWLKLDAKTDDGQVLKQVYRLNTAGGNPPTTCQGQSASFQVEYAAEYWFFE